FSGGKGRSLMWKPLNDSPERVLTAATFIQNPQDWSGDGRFLLYYEIGAADTLRDLWVLPMGPEGKAGEPKLYLRTKYNEFQSRFSPEKDPRWVAYVSDESGQFEVYIQSFPVPHGATRISTNGGGFPQWNQRGGEL